MTDPYSVKSSSFSIGLCFYYWEYYKSIKEFDQNNTFNINEHGGYDIRDLFVSPKYKTFKQEIMEYQHLSGDNMKNYATTIIPKCKQYLNHSAVIKQKRAWIQTGATSNAVMLKYGIATNTDHRKDNGKGRIILQHLISLVLYTDYSEHSTAFSATFRPQNAYEPLFLIKQRNQIYYWMSKYLRELVQIFGDGGSRPYKDNKGDRRKYVLGGSCNKNGNNAVTHPYFSGLSFEAAFPSFQIRFHGPTSVTDQIAVAVKFAGMNGVVVQLKNDVPAHFEYIRGYDASSISAFAEESETILFGGHYMVSIQTIKTVKKPKDYEKICKVIKKLNKMIIGYAVTDEIDQYEKQVIQYVFSVLLKSMNEEEKKEKDDNEDSEFIVDFYEKQTITSYIQHQQQIYLDLHILHTDNDKYLNTLFMEEMKKYKVREQEYKSFGYFSSASKENMFKQSLLKMYKNVKAIIIKTTSIGGSYVHPLSFSVLLETIKQYGNIEKVTIKATRAEWTGGRNKSWISFIWNMSKLDLIKMYKKHNINIMYKIVKGDVHHEDCIIIKR